MNETSRPALDTSVGEQRTRLTIHFLLGVVLLLLVPLLHGSPFIFHDSGTYYLYGEHIVSTIAAAIERNRAAIIPLGELEESYVGARSPTFSLLLYLTASAATLWGVVAAQAAAAALLLLTFAKAVCAARWTRCYWALLPVLVMGSSLPYFVAYAMPDVFAGLGALALILIVLHGQELSKGAHLAAWATLAFSASSHGTLPIVFAAAAAAGLLGRMLVARLGRTRLVVLSVGSAILAGALAGPAYREAERRVFAHPIASPPFVTARVLEDGTGVDYLEEACAEAKPYALCRLKIEAPVNSDTFLWNKAGEGGVYLATDAATREALREEQARFVIGTVSSRPVEQLRVSLGNWWQQLRLVEVVEPLWDPGTQASYHLFQSTGNLPRFHMGLAPEPALAAIRSAVLWTSLAGLGLLALWALNGRDPHGRYVLTFLLILAVVIVANAAVCGILSKPYPRYQSRLIWLLPAGIVLIAYHPRVLQAISAASERLLAHRKE
jgi:hypothetical protein